MAAPTFQELYDLGRAEAIALRPDLVVADGDITDMLLAAATAMADKNVQYASEEILKTYVNGATGDDLTVLADDHFNIQRKVATAAQVTLSFARPAGAEPATTIFAGHLVATVLDAAGDTVEFATDINLFFGVGINGPLTVSATAVEEGAGSNVLAGEITRILDSISNDASFTVTNSVAAAGGNDEETDEELRARIKALSLTLRRGTLAALEFGALTVPSVRVAVASEDITTGIVRVAVSDSAGSSNSQMTSDVETALEEYRAAGTDVTVVGGKVLSQVISVQLRLEAGFQASTLLDSVSDAIVERVSELKLGETLYLTMIRTAAQNTNDAILDVVVITPASDVVPDDDELIRVTGTPTVTEVP